MSGSSTGADAQAAASAAAPAVEEDAQYWRLKDRVPGFIYELFSSQNKGAQVPGVVSLHYEDGVQLKDAGDQASVWAGMQ